MSKVLTDKQFELVKKVVNDYLIMNTDMEKQFSEVLQLNVDFSAGMQQQSEPEDTLTVAKYDEFVEAIERFGAAASELSRLWITDDYSSKGYPFNKSFDDVALDIWLWHDTEYEELHENFILRDILKQYNTSYKYLINWEDVNNGGGFRVFYKEFTNVRGERVLVGVNNDSIGIYNISKEQFDKGEVDLCDHYLEGCGFDNLYDAYTITDKQLYEDFKDTFTEDQCADIIHAIRAYIGKYCNK